MNRDCLKRVDRQTAHFHRVSRKIIFLINLRGASRTNSIHHARQRFLWKPRAQLTVCRWQSIFCRRVLLLQLRLRLLTQPCTRLSISDSPPLLPVFSSSFVNLPLSPPITPSLFHSRFKPFSLHGILFLNVAVSTIESQCSREAVFFHAYIQRADVQWSQIRFNGSEPRVVGSYWRWFPVWWRLANRSSNCVRCSQRIPSVVPLPCWKAGTPTLPDWPGQFKTWAYLITNSPYITDSFPQNWLQRL